MHYKTELEEKAEDLRQVDCPMGLSAFPTGRRPVEQAAASEVKKRRL